MKTEGAPTPTQQFAPVAVAVRLCEEIVPSSLSVMRRNSAWLQGILVILAMTLLLDRARGGRLFRYPVYRQGSGGVVPAGKPSPLRLVLGGGPRIAGTLAGL